MRVVLFCQNSYSFGILEPIKVVLEEKSHDYIWYVADKILDEFPYQKENFTNKITDVKKFQSDVIFVPGNAVPHYLRGLKTQIFHGLAGEKKGHFRIRHYFDLYLTQGPYFTEKFLELKNKYNDFDVIETGWPKLDIYAKNQTIINKEKTKLLHNCSAKKIILYAPTFSPKLTSAPHLFNSLKKLANNPDYLILIKFHPLMDSQMILLYRKLATTSEQIIYETNNNIIKFLLMSDLLISDTSSVIYEFLLLDKPVITFNNISNNIQWENSNDYSKLIKLVEINLSKDPFAGLRSNIRQHFHPYSDGKSALRMVHAVENYILTHGIPSRRKLSLLRRLKINVIFGKQPSEN